MDLIERQSLAEIFFFEHSRVSYSFTTRLLWFQCFLFVHFFIKFYLSFAQFSSLLKSQFSQAVKTPIIFRLNRRERKKFGSAWSEKINKLQLTFFFTIPQSLLMSLKLHFAVLFIFSRKLLFFYQLCTQSINSLRRITSKKKNICFIK